MHRKINKKFSSKVLYQGLSDPKDYIEYAEIIVK